MLLQSLVWPALLALATAQREQGEGAESRGCGRRHLPEGAEGGQTSSHRGEYHGLRRTWHVHLPKGYEHGKPAPLVMALHGWRLDGLHYQNESGLSDVSDEHGFVVVYPDGYGDNEPKDTAAGPWNSWNVVGTTQSPGPEGPICAPMADHPEFCYKSCKCEDRPQCSWTTCANDITPRGVGTSEATGFLPRLLDRLLDEYCIDEDRLYVTGVSNGGMATYQMGVSLSHRLAAIAPTCGSFARGFAQVPTVPLPVMDVHGFSDTEVPGNATEGDHWAESADGYYYTPVANILEGWRDANQCKDEEAVTLSHWRTNLDGMYDLYCVQEGRGCDAPVVRCGYTGAHGPFPNGPGLRGGVLNGKLVWEFLSQFKRPRKEPEASEQRQEEEATPKELGPGRGAWRVEEPEKHGLDGKILRAAAAEVMETIEQRHCLLIVKDGAIIHEEYGDQSSEAALQEIDSLGKWISAMIVGAAMEAGYFNLDTPLIEYGLQPQCGNKHVTDCFQMKVCPAGVECPNSTLGFYPNITARVLLAQASGCEEGEGCFAAPGTVFSYDSGMYLQHLSAIIAHTTGRSALDFASYFMEKLGIPKFFAYDEVKDGWSVGGGQLSSCRTLARVAQLVLNKGLWPMPGGGVQRLVGESFLEEMSSPQFPHRGYSYGFLVWLNRERDPEVSPKCCGDRGGCMEQSQETFLEHPFMQDEVAGSEPMTEHVIIATGWLGHICLIVPGRNISIVSLGNTWGSSNLCRLGATRPNDPKIVAGYDNTFTLGLMWHLLDKATQAGDLDEQGHHHERHHDHHHERHHDHKEASKSHVPLLSKEVEDMGGEAKKVRNAVDREEEREGAAIHGSCSCLCVPGRGQGYCYDMPTGVKDCNAVAIMAAIDCPGVGVVRQCQTPQQPEDTDCAAMGRSIRGDDGKKDTWGGHVSCSLSRNCSGGAWSSSACSCRPALYGKYACFYDSRPCGDKDEGLITPYYGAGSRLVHAGKGAAVGAVPAGEKFPFGPNAEAAIPGSRSAELTLPLLALAAAAAAVPSALLVMRNQHRAASGIREPLMGASA